jgi:hypothetical protein
MINQNVTTIFAVSLPCAADIMVTGTGKEIDEIDEIEVPNHCATYDDVKITEGFHAGDELIDVCHLNHLSSKCGLPLHTQDKVVVVLQWKRSERSAGTNLKIHLAKIYS